MHEEKFELLDVVDEELVEPVGHEVAGALVGPYKKPNDNESRTSDADRDGWGLDGQHQDGQTPRDRSYIQQAVRDLYVMRNTICYIR